MQKGLNSAISLTAPDKCALACSHLMCKKGTSSFVHVMRTFREMQPGGLMSADGGQVHLRQSDTGCKAGMQLHAQVTPFASWPALPSTACIMYCQKVSARCNCDRCREILQGYPAPEQSASKDHQGTACPDYVQITACFSLAGKTVQAPPTLMLPTIDLKYSTMASPIAQLLQSL